MRFRSARAEVDEPSESGFTILELVVALGLLAFVMTALAGAFYSAAGVAVSNNLRTQATGVATRVLEAYRAIPYAELGFYTDQGVSPKCDTTAASLDTVILGPTTPDTDADGDKDPSVVPTEPLTVPGDDTSFTVTRCVVWADAPGTDPAVPDYKRTRVDVSWVDSRQVTRKMSQQSIVYPGGLNTTATVVTAIPGCSPNQPGPAGVVAPSDTAKFDQLDVTWTYSAAPNPHHFGVQWDKTGSFTSPLGEIPTGDGDARSISLTGLAGGTKYFARVIAYCDAGESLASTGSTAGNATTHPDPSTICSVGPLNAATNGSPSSDKKLYVRSNGKWGVDITVSVNTTAACAGSFEVEMRGPNGATTLRESATLNGSGLREKTLNTSNKSYPVGTYALTLLRGGIAQPGGRTFQVCAYPQPVNVDWTTSAC